MSSSSASSVSVTTVAPPAVAPLVHSDTLEIIPLEPLQQVWSNLQYSTTGPRRIPPRNEPMLYIPQSTDNRQSLPYKLLFLARAAEEAAGRFEILGEGPFETLANNSGTMSDFCFLS